MCIIPVSAHGTNPASAAMCGMKIVSVGTDAKGNINIEELRKAAEANRDNLSALMVSSLFILCWKANILSNKIKEDGELCSTLHSLTLVDIIGDISFNAWSV